MYRSPQSDQKVSERARHNYVALPKAKGRRESDRIMPWPDRDFQVSPWRPLFYRSAYLGMHNGTAPSVSAASGGCLPPP